MKPLFLDRSNKLNSSFSIEHRKLKNFLKVWHYHSELELVVVLQSTGTRFVGNHIDRFNGGELILLGKNLPHMWMNDPAYFEKDFKLETEAIVVHFKEDFVGDIFMDLPELLLVSKLIERAKAGIKFTGSNIQGLIHKITALEELDNFERLISFIKILNDLASETEYEVLSSLSFVEEFAKADKQKLEPVYEFIINNFKKNFTLDDIAKVAFMNPSAFSRYFKKVHKKTLTRYIIELRIGYACKLLLENKYSMTSICFESGFNNVSNFNRQFKKILGHSPSEYLRKIYRK